MTVTRAQFISLLEPILRDIRSDSDYPRRPLIYQRFFEVGSSKKATETRFNWAGLGTFEVKAEGGAVTYKDPIAGSELKVTHVRRSLGYKITQEMIDHEQYNEMRKLERALQLAGEDDLEIAGHLLLNNGFGTTDSGGFEASGFDTLALFSTAHTRLDGGTTQANRPSTDASLSWTSLADGIVQFSRWRDHRGVPLRATPRLLIVHPNDIMTARELLGSPDKPNTTDRAINALRQDNLEFVSSEYLTDTNAWFLKGEPVDTFWYWDVNPRTAMDDDFDSEIIKRKRIQGFSLGHGEWYGWYGTSGTT